jgi:hypothetical protein
MTVVRRSRPHAILAYDLDQLVRFALLNQHLGATSTNASFGKLANQQWST